MSLGRCWDAGKDRPCLPAPSRNTQTHLRHHVLHTTGVEVLADVQRELVPAARQPGRWALESQTLQV